MSAQRKKLVFGVCPRCNDTLTHVVLSAAKNKRRNECGVMFPINFNVDFQVPAPPVEDGPATDPAREELRSVAPSPAARPAAALPPAAPVQQAPVRVQAPAKWAARGIQVE
jgi:hypothetical protein